MLSILKHSEQTQEAKEVMQEDGRWFSFAITMASLIILERKDLPPHLASLECLEVATPLKQVLRLLEDSGEADLLSFKFHDGSES